MISPSTYENNDSFKKTQCAKPRFFIGKEKAKNMFTRTSDAKKFVPGPGTHDIKLIDRGYAKITLGASRGWK